MHINRFYVNMGLILSLLLWLSNAEATDFRICYEAEQVPPLTNGKYTIPDTSRGYLVDRVLAAANSSGLKANLYRTQWKRCIRDLKTGRTDALFSMIWSEERANYARFPLQADGSLDPSRSLWHVYYSIFSRRPLWDGKSFQGVVNGIGAPQGYIVKQKLQQAGVLSDMSYTIEEGLTMVAAGKLDGYVISQIAGEKVLEQLKLKGQITAQMPFLFSSDLHAPVSIDFYNKHSAQVEQFWNYFLNRSAHEIDP